MSFKVGDRVKLLPGVVHDWVAPSEVGKIYPVIRLEYNHCIVSARKRTWVIQYKYLEKVNIPGQQLKFDFMK